MSSSPNNKISAAGFNWKVTLCEPDIGTEEIEAVTEVLKRRWLTAGGVTARFEKQFAERLNVKNAIAVSNCSAALLLANQALGIGRGDEVICPSLTFAASANASIFAGASVVFADIRSEHDLTVDPSDIESKITEKTKAITVVHYAGFSCMMDEITEIAERHGLHIIEDCAHAPLMSHVFKDGKVMSLGSIGEAGCFSFYGNKNITTGEGGMVTANDDAIAEKIRLLRSHGMSANSFDKIKGHAFKYDITSPGFNFRFDDLRASIGIVQLDKLEKSNAVRKKVAGIYLEYFDNSPVSIPFRNRYETGQGLHIFPVLLPRRCDRNSVMMKLKESGIQSSIHYSPIHLFSYYRENFGCKKGSLPVTERVSERILTLPLHSRMSGDNAAFVAENLLKVIA